MFLGMNGTHGDLLSYNGFYSNYNVCESNELIKDFYILSDIVLYKLKQSIAKNEVIDLMLNFNILTEYSYIDYIDGDDMLLEYIPVKKLHLFEGDFWNRELRKKYCQKTKPSKIFSKFNEKYTTQFLTKLNFIFSTNQKYNPFILKEVSGEDIRKYYLEDNYNNQDRQYTLQNSCMKHDECSDYLDIYCKEPNVKMLIKINTATEKINARAIIWTCDDGSIFMDRMYVTDEYEIEEFKQYASKNGYFYKKHQRASYTDDINENKYFITIKDNEERLKNFTVTLKNRYKLLPYMDSFNVLNEGKLYFNIRTSFESRNHLLTGTSGNTSYVCDKCGYIENNSNRNSFSYGEYICSFCRKEMQEKERTK